MRCGVVPWLGAISPTRSLTRVLFPAPFGPTQATLDASATPQDTPSRMMGVRLVYL